MPGWKWTGVAAGVILAFGAVVAGLLRAIPSPHTPFDYLIVGTLATLLSLVVLFALVGGISFATFFRRRPRGTRTEQRSERPGPGDRQ